MGNNFEKMDVMQSSQNTESWGSKKISEKSGDSNTNSRSASQKKEEEISTNFLNEIEVSKEESPTGKSEEKNTCPEAQKESTPITDNKVSEKLKSFIPMTEESNESSLQSLGDDLSSIDEESPCNQKNKPSPVKRKLSDLYNKSDNRKNSEDGISEENDIMTTPLEDSMPRKSKLLDQMKDLNKINEKNEDKDSSSEDSIEKMIHLKTVDEFENLTRKLKLIQVCMNKDKNPVHMQSAQEIPLIVRKRGRSGTTVHGNTPKNVQQFVNLNPIQVTDNKPEVKSVQTFARKNNRRNTITSAQQTVDNLMRQTSQEHQVLNNLQLDFEEVSLMLKIILERGNIDDMYENDVLEKYDHLAFYLSKNYYKDGKNLEKESDDSTSVHNEDAPQT